jgi:hypothetical protein
VQFRLSDSLGGLAECIQVSHQVEHRLPVTGILCDPSLAPHHGLLEIPAFFRAPRQLSQSALVRSEQSAPLALDPAIKLRRAMEEETLHKVRIVPPHRLFQLATLNCVVELAHVTPEVISIYPYFLGAPGDEGLLPQTMPQSM